MRLWRFGVALRTEQSAFTDEAYGGEGEAVQRALGRGLHPNIYFIRVSFQILIITMSTSSDSSSRSRSRQKGNGKRVYVTGYSLK